MTRVNWNGGAQPLETLFARLLTNTLDPRFEQYGNFITFEPRLLNGTVKHGLTNFWGNFYDYSHCFSIDTDDPLIVTALTKAIRENQQTEAYKAAKDEIVEAKAADEQRERERRQAYAERRARRAY